MIIYHQFVSILALAALGLIAAVSDAYKFKVKPTPELIKTEAIAAVKEHKKSGGNEWVYKKGTKRFLFCNALGATMIAEALIGVLKETTSKFASFLGSVTDEVMAKFEAVKGDCDKLPKDADCKKALDQIMAAVYEGACSKIETDKAEETPALPQAEKELLDKVITGDISQ